MRRSILLSFVLCAICLLTNERTFAQRSASASGSASAKVVGGISISRGKHMAFGSVSRVGTGGVCVLNPDGTRTMTSNLSPGPGNSESEASFSVTGEPSYAYTITFPSSITLTENGSTKGGPTTMEVTDFKSSKTSDQAVFSTAGTDNFTVGASLHVQQSQDKGDYTGSFSVTVSYQ